MSSAFPIEIVPLGDSALLVRLGTRIDSLTFNAVRSFTQALEQHGLAGMVEYVPAFNSVAIYYRPTLIRYADITQAVAEIALQINPDSKFVGRMIEIPVCYGHEFGEDIEFVASYHGLSVDDVIKLHVNPTYLVHMLGFVPGFPYLGGMTPQLATPRKATPRLQVAAGSVGIAGEQTGVYPLDTPGGWQIIGRTPLPLFRAENNPPTLLQAGDQVRFVAISREEYHTMREANR